MKPLLKIKITGLMLLLVLIMTLFSGTAWARTAALPITIDYPMLGALVASGLFEKNQSEIDLANDPIGCKKLVISDPIFSQENSRLRFELKVRMKAGLETENDCYLPVEWEGYVVFFQTPVIDPKTFQLSFFIQDSLVLNKKHEPGIISGPLWNLIKEKVHTRLDGIRVDVIPCINEMKSFLAIMFPEKDLTQAQAMVDSMTPSPVAVLGNAIRIDMNVDITSVYDDTRTREEAPLSEAELAAFTGTWETMDAFIAYTLASLAGEPLTPEERQMVLATLIDTRYRFLEALEKPEKETDFVRVQFVDAWARLSPLFRRHMGKKPSQSPMGMLAFFSSLDALKALDDIGPALGIEISRNGLLRLARLVSDRQEGDLIYSFAIDQNLRTTLGLEPELTVSPDDVKKAPGREDDLLQRILNRLTSDVLKNLIPVSEAIAADKKKPEEDPARWLPDPNDTKGYVQKIRKELKTAADKVVVKTNPAPENRDLYYMIVDALAWQESCFRQFEESSKGDIRYLRSYNNTSVGLMQINEKVWRGIYDTEQLRWNVRYNVAAGCEIANLYLQQYIIKKMQEKHYPALENKENISRTLYAMYNGGPGEFSKFQKRLAKKKFYSSDELFYQKYLWVKGGRFEKAGICLSGL